MVESLYQCPSCYIIVKCVPTGEQTIQSSVYDDPYENLEARLGVALEKVFPGLKVKCVNRAPHCGVYHIAFTASDSIIKDFFILIKEIPPYYNSLMNVLFNEEEELVYAIHNDFNDVIKLLALLENK